MAIVRWKDKPAMVALAGTEVIAATSIDGGGPVDPGDDINIPLDQLKEWLARRQLVNVALSDMDTALATGTGKAVWFAPEAGTLAGMWIGVNMVSSSGVVTVDLNNGGGTSMFSTRPSIDASENTSLTGTAGVVTGTLLFAKGDRFTFDIDAAGTGAKGLQAVIEYVPA